jgi:hypothetical protein
MEVYKMGEETNPSQETNFQPSGEEPNLTEIQREEGSSPKKPSGLLIGGGILVALLIIAGLFLPPISLGERLGGGQAETAVTPTTEPATADTGNLSIPGEITLILSQGAANVSVSGVSLDEFLQAQANAAMPDYASVQGNIYTVSYEGEAPEGQANLGIPAGAPAESMDLYGWDGSQWRFIPSQVDNGNRQIVSDSGRLPQAYALVVFTAVPSPDMAVSLMSDQELPVELLPVMTTAILGKLSLAEDGALSGDISSLPTGPYEQFLSASNVGPIINQAALSAVLNDATAQATQINSLVSAAQAAELAGVNLDYQEVSASDRAAYTQFVTALAEALRQNGLKLNVTLGEPQNLGGRWETGGQDWAAIGQLADRVNLRMPLDPAAYADGGEADQLLRWAVRQIDRQKLNMLVSASAINRVGESFVEMSNEEALHSFGELAFVEGGEEVEPGTAVSVALSGTANPLEWDGSSLTYKYSYENNGQTHDVWLANAASLAYRLRLAQAHKLGGVTVTGLGDSADGPGYAAALNSFAGLGDAPAPASAAIVWTVRDESGSIIASGSGEDLTFAWDGAEAPGLYTIHAEFALGDNVASLDEATVLVATAVAEEEVVEEEVVAEAPQSGGFSGTADAVVRSPANVRTGPGVTYGIIAGGLNPGAEVELVGRNSDASWLNIIMPSGERGWIFATLVDVNPGVNVSSLDVVEVAPPVVAAGGGGGGTTAPAPGSGAPPPVSVGPVANPGFELGGQTHTFSNPQLMSSAGMNWVKFQQKWGPGANPADLAGRINQAHANGFKVLLSIPGNPYPTEIDFAAYTEYLRGVAALGPDAIEVWNEMNIDFEWPAGQIDPASYVNNMLAPAYNAIKSANPNVMVISGAPAPTGFDNGTNAWSDSRYMAGMAAAGGARYLDCVGAHFNAGASPPSQNTGHPTGSDHYSWYLIPTLNVYAQLGKPVCFTELGYLSGEDYGGVPSRFAWAGATTVGQHAQWLAEAVSISANSGKVRMVIIFNVDFTQWGDDPQAGYAMIRRDGSCPACGTLARVMGR